MYIYIVLILVSLLNIFSTEILAGDYSSPSNPDHYGAMVPDPAISGFPIIIQEPNSATVSRTIFSQWASSCVSYNPAGTVAASWKDPAKALGPATGDQFDICSLGDASRGSEPGSIVLGFAEAIADGPGPDIVVFENGFSANFAPELFFAELAFVDVSSDGISFVRFPSVSLNDENVAISSYAPLDPANVYNLAGKHFNYNGKCWGTPFDLNQLKNTEEVQNGEVDLANINYVRIVDIPGTGEYYDEAVSLPDLSTLDTESGSYELYESNHKIRDAWKTYESGGFDLEAVGVLELINGDGNTDGIVDNKDLEIMLNHWLEPAYWYYGDYNQDGYVNMLDMAILLLNWQIASSN